MQVKTQQEFVEQIKFWIRTDVQSIHVIAGSQQALAEDLIIRAYQETKQRKNAEQPVETSVATWDVATGLLRKDQATAIAQTNNLGIAVRAVTKDASNDAELQRHLGSDACVIFRDPHHDLRTNPVVISIVKEAIKSNRFGTVRLPNEKMQNRCVFWLSNSGPLSPELGGYVKVIELPLPTRDEIPPIVDRLMRPWPQEIKDSIAEGTPLRRIVCSALSGLTSRQIEDSLAESVLRSTGGQRGRGLTEDIRHVIEKNKADVLRHTETLSYEPYETIMAAPDLRGYENLDEWIQQRRIAYSDQAEALKLDMPKGIGLAGIPGTGKSVAARRVARGLRLPLVTFDFSAVFGSLVGESEKRMRDTLAAVSAMDGCVLLIDEVDKALGNADQGGNDSGTSARVFGKLLTWMAEKKDRTFVVFTMNRIERLPPELLRRGRLDEMFFVDLPGPEDRKAILELHMTRRLLVPTNYSPADWAALVSRTEGFVGAELEETIKAARLLALTENPESSAVPTIDQLLRVIDKVTPLSKADSETVESIRAFCSKQAVPVSREADRAKATEKVRKSRSGKPVHGERQISLETPSDNHN